MIMKNFRVFSVIFVFLFLQLTAAALLICFSPISRQPILLSPSKEATQQSVEMLDALCRGDYTAAEQYLLGQPSLGADRPAADEAGRLFWDAFVESLSYEIQGPCLATDSGLAQTVAISYLDIDATSTTLRQRSEALLASRLANSKNTYDVYDGNNNYREDVVMEVLCQAVADALQEDAVYRTVTVTVNMVHSNGQWWIVPDNDLINAISGSVTQ
jgi:hypothetical protein